MNGASVNRTKYEVLHLFHFYNPIDFLPKFDWLILLKIIIINNFYYDIVSHIITLSMGLNFSPFFAKKIK
jgi:hypothetical protein